MYHSSGHTTVNVWGLKFHQINNTQAHLSHILGINSDLKIKHWIKLVTNY